MDSRGLRRAIAICGSQNELARRVGLTGPALAYWFQVGVPVRRLASVVKATGGLVTARELRPDLGSLLEKG